MSQNYFQIDEHDIKVLENNGCQAEDWNTVYVSPEFDSTRVRDVVFEGEIKLGGLTGEVVRNDSRKKKCGIYKAKLNNVTIEDNCYISNVNIELSNLVIQSGVIIENVGKIACVGETTFGNGHEISVFNEAGGRELKITKQTSAQIAYMTVAYRDNQKLINKLNEITTDFVTGQKSNKALIANNVQIYNCNKIVNVAIGESALIDGALSLVEGTVDSSTEAPTFVGDGVIAEHFIVQKGASVTESAILSSTLVGEASQAGKMFSSENCVLFANSEGFHSEICSIFAGPYSVTHHKSTLLIAGMFSFFNAGSGTNQSNHMYKLGPVHQGILERGCKTGSSSYLLWPSRVGAFTAIIGKHYANFDSSNLPFSYINEKDGKSVITPAMNFFTTGTLRDGYKWPSRDRRKSAKKLDLIIFDVLSPYSVQKVMNGKNILAALKESADKKQEFVTHKNIHIKRLLLKTGTRYYQLIIDKYFGDMLVKRFKKEKPDNLKDILTYEKNPELANADWLDLSGLLCSKKRVESLIADVINGNINSLEKLQSGLENIYNSYDNDSWNWFLLKYKELNDKELADETNDNLINFLDSWKDSSLKLLNMVAQDSQKEFEGNTRISFGIDGNTDTDFDNVRGTFADNKFVKQINEEIEAVNLKYEALKKLISV
ncbi:DUF4954 family protein [candidate division KSB1 bacterium]|nr:DUF4954 family protein [candidate division KSB1 bacterium]MBL7093578.1 DUF4954 family protein [candidate division KSB1 bacterium]